MPYDTVDSLPPAVKKLPGERQRQFMHVWNSAYNSCQSKGGSNCEEHAFAQAWGVVKKEYEEEDLCTFTCKIPEDGEAVALGAFVEELEKYVANRQQRPNSDFAYVDESGGKHFPIFDEAHVRNALARMNQSPYGPKARPKILAAARRMGIKLDPERWKSEEGAMKLDIPLEKLDAPRGLFYGVVYSPYEVDTQGDFASEEEIEKAAHDFLPSAVMNLHHSEDLEDVQVVESYIAPTDFSINNQMIKKGSWILVTRVLNEELRKAIETGEITAYSLEGTALRAELG